MKIKILDTTKAALKERMDAAAKAKSVNAKSNVSYHAGSAMKRAFITLAADAVELKGEERVSFCKLLDSTPGWFGCGNNSACRQAYENVKGGLGKIQADYSAW